MWEFLSESWNFALRFSVHIVWTSVLSFSNLKLHKIKAVNNPALISKLIGLEPTIQSKTSSWSAVNSKKMWPWWALNLSWRYSHVILVSGYLVLTIDYSMDFQYHICMIKPRLHDLALGGVWPPCSTELASLGARAHNPCN